MELTPEHFGPRHQLGVMFIRTGRYVEAIELLKQAILLNPNSGRIVLEPRCRLYRFRPGFGGNSRACPCELREGRCGRAGKLRLTPQSRGELSARGQLDLALSSFDRAIELNPDNVRARWMRVMVWRPPFRRTMTPILRTAPDSRVSSPVSRIGGVRSETDGAIFVGEAQPFFLTYQEEATWRS